MRSIMLFLVTVRLLSAQLDTNTLTVQASRIVYPQPDQVVFAVYVDSDTETVLDDIVVELEGAGITVDNLAGAARGAFNSSVRWTFTLAVPFTKIADTAASIATAA